MTISKTTFGDSPAAMYLCELLSKRIEANEPGAQALMRKVSKTLTAGREVVNDLDNAHLADALPLRTFSRQLVLISDHNQTKATEAIAKHDPFIAHLVVNILEGEVKSWKRRVQEVARKRSHVARQTAPGQAPTPLNAIHGKDDKTVEVLRQRSKAYLARKGKLDTLY